MAFGSEDIEELGEKAPRPLDEQTIARGSFERLSEGQGAVAARNRSAAAVREPDGKEMGRRTVIAIVAIAAVVIAICVALFVHFLDAPSAVPEEQPEAEQVAAKADDAITYRGSTYELVKGKKGYELKETKENSEQTSLGKLDGTPVALVLYDGALLIPQNFSDGTWNVSAYTIGSGWSQIMDQEGNAVGDKGKVESATLEDTRLLLLVDGSAVEVPLVW